MKLFRLIKVFLMLFWRAAVLNTFLLSGLPALQSPLLLFGVPLLLAAILVFGLGRTLLVFPLIRLLIRANPLPTEAELDEQDQEWKHRRTEARERARQETPEGIEERRREIVQQRITEKRRQELEHAEQVEQIRNAENDGTE